MASIPEDGDRTSFLLRKCAEFMTEDELDLFQQRMASPRSQSSKAGKESEDPEEVKPKATVEANSVAKTTTTKPRSPPLVNVAIPVARPP